MSDAQQKHIPVLDGVRGIAVLAVLVAHFAPEKSSILWVPWGMFGVRLFFVLSGYLITKQLLDFRQYIDEGGSTGLALKNFYGRRFLRIFPIYYLTVAAIYLAFSLPSLSWYLLYASNWIGLTNCDDPLAWYWTLAVEEQFYLVWPLCVFTMPRKMLLPLLSACLVLAPASVVAFMLMGYEGVSGGIPWKNTIACLDTFAIGALFAFLAESPNRARRLTVGCLMAFVVLFGSSLPLYLQEGYDFKYSLPFCVNNTYAAGALFGAVLFFDRLRLVRWVNAKIFQWRPLCFLGKISYGVYIYHMFAAWLIPPAFKRMGVPWPNDWLPQTAIYLTVTLVVSVASWYLIEKPIIRLKRHFPCPPGKDQERAAVAFHAPPS